MKSEKNDERKAEKRGSMIYEIRRGDGNYPELLEHIDRPPDILYGTGDAGVLKKRYVAVVGARRATTYGKWVSYQIGRRLAECGLTVVSGMAYGCDAEAHRGALEAGGTTAAVLGCGVDICYPASNAALRRRIAERGLILSEYEPGTPPRPYRFPQRNRIISGICEAVVIAEAGLSSGSLITAEYAAEQGRRVFAVPGSISAPGSLGCNKLIQDGAELVAVIDDILSGLGVAEEKERPKAVSVLGKDERKIYETVRENGEVTADFIARTLGKSVTEINAAVGVLEIKGLLVTSAGKIFIM